MFSPALVAQPEMTLYCRRLYAKMIHVRRGSASDVSTQFSNATSEGWQRLCPGMYRATVAADHISILEGSALTEVVRAIADWVIPLGDEISRRI